MTPNDRERFAALLTDALAFYGQTVSPFALNVWWQACQSITFDALQRALSRHAMDPERGMFAPKPADIVRQIQGTPTDRAARAWGLALDAASRVGAYTDVVFDDPIIHVVIEDLGGWPGFCRCEAEKLSYQQHRFLEAYRAFVNRGDLESWPKRLHGDRSPDDVYMQRGLPPPKPVLLGDQRRAALVLERGSNDGRRQLSSIADMADGLLARLEDSRSREDAA